MFSPGTFRAKALAKIQSPEQLDRRLQVASPRTWIALFGLLAIIAAAVLWATISTIPSTVSGAGFVIPEGGWNSIEAPTPGIITVLDLQVGDPVVANEAVALLTGSSGSVTVRSPTTGTVEQVTVSSQQFVGAGTQMAVIRPEGEPLIVHAYIPTGLAHEIPPGAAAQVSPGIVAPSAYGYLEGRVTAIALLPATQQGLLNVLQNPSLVNQVSAKGPVTEVLVALIPAHTPSGYAWSLGEGPPFPALSEGLPTTVSVEVSSEHPIDYVF